MVQIRIVSVLGIGKYTNVLVNVNDLTYIQDGEMTIYETMKPCQTICPSTADRDTL